MKKKLSLTVKRWMLIVTATIVAVMLVAQVLSQSFFTGYVEDIYETNINITASRIASEINTTFTNMNTAVDTIAINNATRDYAATADSEERYAKAFNNVRPLVQIAIQNLGFDKLVILDNTGAFYCFWGTSLPNSAGIELKKIFASNQRDITNSIIEFDGEAFYCTTKPIIPSGTIGPVGMVAALTSVENTRNTLVDYGEDGKFTIALHDFDHILFSNNAEFESQQVTILYDTPDLFIYEDEIPIGSLGIFISIPYSEIFPQRTALLIVFFSVGLLALILILVLLLFVNRIIIRPFTHVIDETRQLGDHNPSTRLTKTNVTHVDLLVQSINAMLDRLDDSSRRIIETQQSLYELEISQREVQMYLLRNQINRHFLYNSLTSVRSLADRGENEKVKEIAGGIAQLLRYTTSKIKEVNIFDEMEIVSNYVNIQNIRFDNRLHFEIDVDDRLCGYKILKLLIQPLVENSLIHGLEPKHTEECTLWLRGHLLPDSIRIEVTDDGLGIPEDKLKKIQWNIEHYEEIDVDGDIEGIALVNVQKRIAMGYGAEYGLSVDSAEGEYTRAVMTLPLVPDENMGSGI